MRIYGLVALVVAIGFAGWAVYLVWSGRREELDPLWATSSVIMLWLYTLLDARGAMADMRAELEQLHYREAAVTRKLRETVEGTQTPLVDRFGPR
jgi:hypothetical protein